MAELQVAEALVIKPGDHLVIRVDRDSIISRSEVDELRRAVLDRIPGIGDVAVIAADGLAVYREESDG